MWQPKVDAYEPSLRTAVALAAAMVAEVQSKQPARWFTLEGVTGCGKTMIMRQVFTALARENPHNSGPWIHPGQEASDWTRRPGNIWMTASDFADAIRSDFKLPERLAQDFVVAIDDVGAARDTTAFIADGLYRLCNVRLGKLTLFTTNLTLGDVAVQIDQRVASRLIRDGNVVHRIVAGDYALRTRK